MSRSERFNTRSEIKRHFGDSFDQNNGAGVVVYAENGKKYVDDTEAHAAVIGRTGKVVPNLQQYGRTCNFPFRFPRRVHKLQREFGKTVRTDS